MSVAMPAAPGSAPSGGVTLFGRRISYDALLLAGATLLGVFFAYNLSKSGAGVNLGVPADAGGVAGANPTLPDPSGVASTLTAAPAPSTILGGGYAPAIAPIGGASDVAPRATSNAPVPRPQPEPAGGLAPAHFSPAPAQRAAASLTNVPILGHLINLAAGQAPPPPAQPQQPNVVVHTGHVSF